MNSLNRKGEATGEPVVGASLVPWTIVGLVGLGLSQATVVISGIVSAGGSARGLQLALTSLSILIVMALLSAFGLHLLDRRTLQRDRALSTLRPSAWRTISAKETAWRESAERVEELGELSKAFYYFAVTADSSGVEVWIGGNHPTAIWKAARTDVLKIRAGYTTRSFRQIPTIWVTIRTQNGSIDLPISLNAPGQIAVRPVRASALDGKLTAFKEALQG